MTDRSAFSDDEWEMLVSAPMLAGMAVTAAEPSGVWGLLKESMTVASEMTQARADPVVNPLVRAIAADYQTVEGRAAAQDELTGRMSASEPADVKVTALAALAEAAALLDAKAPRDGGAVKEWLLTISQHVAQASREGGFLGFGGVEVSEAENAILAQIRTALRLA
jgi:hypothetical protein